MNEKHTLVELEQEENALRKKIAENIAEINRCHVEKEELITRLKALRENGTSNVGETAETLQERLFSIEGMLVVLSKERRRLTQELKSNKKNQEKLQIDYTEFIEGQITKMLSEFLAYVEANKHDIESYIRKAYRVKAVTHYKGGYHRYLAPTGEIGIFDIMTDELIVKSDVPSFNEEMCTLSKDKWQYIVCTYTNWFNRYINQFVRRICDEATQNIENDMFVVKTVKDAIVLIPKYTL